MSKDLQAIKTKFALDDFYGIDTPISNVFYTKKQIESKDGVLRLGKEKIENKEYFKYLKYKNPKETSSSMKDYYNTVKNDLGFYDVCVGVNGKTGKPLKVELAKNPYTHYSFIGQSGSGKSVAILWQLFQLYQKENTEFYIIKKSDGDFNIMFENLQKFKMILNSDTIERDDFESFVNYLELEKIKRSFLFKKHKVGSFREYNEKYHNGGKNNGMETINLGIIVFDEYETARKRLIEQRFGFDNAISQWLNVFRSFGFVVIFGTQTYQKDNLGPIRDGMSMHWAGNTSYLATDNQYIKENCTQGIINGTNSFINIGDGNYMRTPYSSEGQVTDILKDLEDKGGIIPYDYVSKKYDTGYLLLNDFVFNNRTLLEDSKIISNSDLVLKEMGITEQNILNLKETNHYLPFLVLAFAIYIGNKGGVIDKTFNVFEKPNFKNQIDILLFGFLEKYQDKAYNEMIKELKVIFENGNDEEFLQTVGNCLNMFAKRFAGTGNLL